MARMISPLVGALLCLSAGWASGQAAARPASESPPVPILSRPGYEEPFVPTAAISPEDQAELARTLALHEQRQVADDFSALTQYLSDHRRSPFRVAVLSNLGFKYYHYGYFARAIDAWQQAWEAGKSVIEPHARVLVDRAVGELLRMHARLGHADEVASLLQELGDRPVSGPATEAVAAAREALTVMRNDPGIAYLCGPMALKNLLLAMGSHYPDVAFLDAVRSGPQGVTLDRVSQLADQAKLPHRIVVRTAGERVPVPSVIHWKVSHFAAIVDASGGRFHVIDPTFGRDLWVTQAAIDSESDGYFLVPDSDRPMNWRLASLAETTQVRGMGYPGGTEDSATCPCDTKSQTQSHPPLATYSFTEMVVSLHISDMPVGYSAPIGPSTKVMLNYNQREAYQPANFSFFNVSQKWTLNWLGYIEDDPNYAGSSVSRYVAGGGDVSYSGYAGTTGQFTPEPRDAAVLSRSTTGAITYRRTLADGGVEVYAHSNGAASFPRLVFLTQVIDSQGNAVSLAYDAKNRLTSLTDATGRLTTFTYGLGSQPLLVTRITDPFGRSAQLGYDTSGRLAQITDVLGLTSRFTYDASSLIDTMITPYGTTRFTYGQNGTYRYLSATDPLGHTERLEWNQPAPAPIPFAEPAALVPVGVPNPFNEYISGRDTFYWDKHAYGVAAGNYGAARVRHWMHVNTNTNQMYHALESYKYPNENRVWMSYPNQSSTGFSGSLDSPTTIGRVLDDGTTQLTQNAYNALGHVTDSIDPVGRETKLTYAANQIDVLTIEQKTSASAFSSIATFTYNGQHLPLTYTDAAGQVTKFTYDAAGQLKSRTNALGEQTLYDYDSAGNLAQIINANGKTQASFSYDAFDRVATATDSEGYTIKYSYDAADRVTRETFPDGSTRSYAWTNLDLKTETDRVGNTTSYAYDAVRNLLRVTDPLNHVTAFGYYENQSLKSLADPNGNTTQWTIDVQNRVTGKLYADSSKVTNIYESTTSRLKSTTDALGQVKQFTYGRDDTLAAVTYSNAVNPTASVTFTYDPYFQRRVSMSDGIGTTTYAYQPIGVNGALQVATEVGPYTNNGVSYQYDVLGRVSVRKVDTSTETFAYDAIGRIINRVNPLGNFTLGYLGQTQQRTSEQSSTVATQWSYDTNLADRRLTAITNPGTARNFQFTSTAENLITSITQSVSGVQQQKWSYGYDNDYRLLQATPASGTVDSYVYDPPGNITTVANSAGSATGTYNDLNQVKSFSGTPFVYDANGNLLNDGIRTYKWDADNRLVGIAYKANAAQSTTFRYDGLGRRLAIVDASGSVSSETRYLWCGDSLCQARSAADVVTRQYYPEGEVIPASSALLYYGQDHLGSVRDTVSAQTGAHVGAYDYDPYGGVAASSGNTSTDFRYAGMFYHSASGLYLANFRAYDARTARWLSRDPISENGGVNLYAYVHQDPTTAKDPNGTFLVGSVVGIIAGGAAGYYSNGWWGAFFGGIAGGVVGAVAPQFSAAVGGGAYGVIAYVATGAVGGAAATLATNAVCKHPLNKGLLGGVLVGAIAPLASFEAIILGSGFGEGAILEGVFGLNSGLLTFSGEIISDHFSEQTLSMLPIQSDFGDLYFPPIPIG